MSVGITTEQSSIEKTVIDADSIIFIGCLPSKQLDDLGEPILQDGKNVYREKTFEEVVFHIDNMLLTLFNDFNLQSYYGFYGVNSKENFRLKIFPEYKANRKLKKVPEFIKEAKEYINQQYGFIPVSGVETDDIVNIVRLDQNIMDCVSDKDNLHLSGVHYNMKTKAMEIVQPWEELKYLYWDMIVGQSGDGISGLHLKGKVFADKFFANYIPEEYLDGTVRNDLLSLYNSHYSDERLALQEFYKNYMCLKLLSKWSEIPDNCNIKSLEDCKLVTI